MAYWRAFEPVESCILLLIRTTCAILLTHELYPNQFELVSYHITQGLVSEALLYEADVCYMLKTIAYYSLTGCSIL